MISGYIVVGYGPSLVKMWIGWKCFNQEVLYLDPTNQIYTHAYDFCIIIRIFKKVKLYLLFFTLVSFNSVNLFCDAGL